ncbi:uncharacterized protein F5891DRAFT_976994 [Suillus fuscotomentosus]|uniref:Uncharacterized protein n=1 Tax=Suillus fuscotomentosus TaxID=1912939 RepID=A0AAD4EEV0_9AGAM|nr:uncharacterized protein F5891DRAFT_976994 [Suillus fuscotomentosus]KAG1904837.1 hypothetical protein F5891DRAFT_976994 [Suillus fuscotomentosus]
MSDPPKHGCRHLKGSKNQPGVKNVGQPHKNGQPAHARNTKDKDPSHVASVGPSAPLAPTPSSLCTLFSQMVHMSIVTVVPSPIHESLEEQPALPSSPLPLSSLAASLLDAQSDPMGCSLCAQPTTPEPHQPMPTNSDLEYCTSIISCRVMVQNLYESDLKANNVHEGDEDKDGDMLEEFTLTCEDVDLEDEAESASDQPMTVDAEHEISNGQTACTPYSASMAAK